MERMEDFVYLITPILQARQIEQEYRCCSCHKKMDYTGKKTCEACLTKRKQRYVKKKTPRRTWEFANEEEFRKFISNHEGYCLVQRTRHVKQDGSEYMYFKCPRWNKSKLPPDISAGEAMTTQDREQLQNERRASLHPRTRHWADSPVIGLKCPYSLTAIRRSPTSVIHVAEGVHKHLDSCKPLKRKNTRTLELKALVEGSSALGGSPFQAETATGCDAAMIATKNDITGVSIVQSGKDETMQCQMQLSPPTCTSKHGACAGACESTRASATKSGGLGPWRPSNFSEPFGSDTHMPFRSAFQRFHPTPSLSSDPLVVNSVSHSHFPSIPNPKICAIIQEAVNSALELPPIARDATLKEIKRMIFYSEGKITPTKSSPKGESQASSDVIDYGLPASFERVQKSWGTMKRIVDTRSAGGR